MEENMPINNYNLKSIGACIIAIMALNNDGLCQSYPVIDIDNVETTILPELHFEDEYYVSIPDHGISNFDDILTIVAREKVDSIHNSHKPVIYKGLVFLYSDKKKSHESVYDLESLYDITSVNKVYYPECIVTVHSEYTKDERFKTMNRSKLVKYMVSIDAATGDTLWKKQVENRPYIRSANHVSMVGDSIIDNKSGKTLYKISPGNGIVEIKDDNGYLYLTRRVAKGIKELIAIDMQKEESIWKARGDFSNFYIDETRIYMNNLCAIDKKTGKLLWNNINSLSFVGIVGKYIIAYQYGEDDPWIFLLSKDNGTIVGYSWFDKELCKSCFGYDDYCNPDFVFAEQGEGNKTAAIIKCNDGVYLYFFEAK